jgi:hypothetical protein
MGSHPRRRVRDVPNGNLRSAACLSLLEALLGKAACRGRVAERHERLRGVDAPGGQAGMADAELAPTRGGGDQVGVRVGGAVLGEPQPAPALKQQRAASAPGGGSPSWPAAASASSAAASSSSSLRASSRKVSAHSIASRGVTGSL